MRKLVIGLSIATIVGAGILSGLKVVTANAQEKPVIQNIEKDLKSVLDGNNLVNWENQLDKKYGDNWDDLLEKKYGNNWEDKFEQNLSKLYPNQIFNDIEDKYDDVDDKHDDIYDKHDDMDDKHDDMDDKYDDVDNN